MGQPFYCKQVLYLRIEYPSDCSVVSASDKGKYERLQGDYGRAVEDTKRREVQEREQKKAKRKFSRGAR
jgi:hypothetical protein